MNFTSDPLLNYPTTQEMQSGYETMERQLAELRQNRQTINMQARLSPTPLWDEIDKIEDALTDGQRQEMMSNQEYANSLQYISKMVQDEVLRIVRPRIEATKQGTNALSKHLEITKRIKKDIAKESERRSALLNEYLSGHSDMTWNDFIRLKQEKGFDK